jgi:hypothetical protein
MNARNIPKLVKVALMMDKIAKSSDKLPKWIKALNPGLHIEHRWVLGLPPEPKAIGLHFLQTRIPSKSLRRLVIRFTGLTQGIVKIVSDAAVEAKCEEGVIMSLTSSGSVIEEGCTMTATPSKTKITEQRTAIERVGVCGPTYQTCSCEPKGLF